MTCEVLVMNRHAVALAADSAVTVSQFVDGKEEKRYFKSVNKVFQLSGRHPVGMMVYGSGDLQQVPWEILTKEYRNHLGVKSFDTLEQYALDLFNFIQNATDIYPRAYQEELFQADCMKAVYSFYFQYLDNDEEYKKTDDDQKEVYIENYFKKVIENLDSLPFLAGFDAADIDEALKIFSASVGTTAVDFLNHFKVKVRPELISEFAIKLIYKKQSYMGETGVVIAGFGDKNYFPGYCHYQCFGIILGKLAYKQEANSEGFQIDYTKHSHIKGFATTNMVNTFQYGIGFDSYLLSGEVCKQALINITNAMPITDKSGLEQAIEAEVDRFRAAFLQQCREKNFEPLTRVVAALPVDDMAELAETLVTLESLKEKVTKPTESVGGPVDVAVITRGEGLVWIKRKHYFNPELNHRYFQRLQK